MSMSWVRTELSGMAELRNAVDKPCLIQVVIRRAYSSAQRSPVDHDPCAWGSSSVFLQLELINDLKRRIFFPLGRVACDT